MPEPVLDLEFKTFGGGNWKDNPGRLPITETDKLINVWGDGQRVKKRPGIKVLEVDCGAGNCSPAGFAEYRLATARHILATIHTFPFMAAYNDAMGYLDLFDGTFTDLGEPAVAPAPSTGIASLSSIVATRTTGADAGYIASTVGWLYVAATPEYVAKDFGGGVPCPTWCVYATSLAWFSCVLFASGGTAIPAHRVAFSQSEKPELQETANDFFKTNPDGDLTPVLALKRAGNDSLYVIKSESIERITGSAREYFDKTTVASGIGGYADRGWADCYGTLIGFCVERSPTEKGDPDAAIRPNEVALLAGAEVKRIGYKVAPRFEDIDPTARREAIAGLWHKRGVAIMIPSAPSERSGAAYTAQTVFPYELRSGTWWEWEIPAALACTAITSAPMVVAGKSDDRLIIGLRKSKVLPNQGVSSFLAYFDESEPTDDGAPMPSYWESAWIDYGKGRLHTSEMATVRGYQKSGGKAIFSIAIDRDPATMTEVCEFDLNEDGATFEIPNGDLGINASRWAKYRIDFPNDGVESEFNYIGVWRKDRGMLKDSTVNA